MGGIKDIENALKEGLNKYEEYISEKSCDIFRTEEIYGQKRENRLAQGDNLSYMKFLGQQENMSGRLQLIYVDPPFFSMGKYQASIYADSPLLGKSRLMKAEAYDDSWNRDLCGYLKMLTVRMLMMRELLSESGCVVIHLDWHVVHYVKIVMDEIFGRSNFVNEIVWTYKSGGSSRKSFSKKHDVLLVYSKSHGYKFNPLTEKSYNRDYKPYRFKDVKEYRDEKGWYTLVNMKDVWNIDMVGRTSGERTGYATQKPEKLMERIVEAFSDEGDICGDFFAGSGSFGAVCGRMNRRWIMCDSENIANSAQIARLAGAGGSFGVERQAGRRNDKEDGQVEFEIKGDSLTLKRYVPSRAARKTFLGSSHPGELERYAEDDSVSLVKFWSVDFNFDGNFHRADLVEDGRTREVETKKIRPGKTVSLMGYDLLGNRFHGLYTGRETEI